MWLRFLRHVIWGSIVALFRCCFCCCLCRRPRLPDLSADVCVVTGAGQGLGRHIALQMARCGATVVLWDVNGEKVGAVAEKIREGRGKAHSYVVDCSRREDVYRAAEQVRREVGDVAVLVNNAAVAFGGSFISLRGERALSDEQIEKTFAVNALGYLWTARAFLPWMVENDYGYVVNVASSAAVYGAPYMSAYSAAKAGIRNFSETIRYELLLNGKRGVSVMCVYPSFMNTAMVNPTVQQMTRERNLPLSQPEDVALDILHGMKRGERDLFIVPSDRLIPAMKIVFPWRAIDSIIYSLSDVFSALAE